MSKSVRSVCVIDDDSSFRSALQLTLKPAGIKCILYAGGHDFLGSELPPEVKCILLDARMPGMSGIELVQILNERKIFVPIILVTAFGNISMAVTAMKAGVFDILEKPIGTEDLLDRLERAFRLHEQWQAVAVERKKIAKRLALLTPRELEVLVLMVAGKKNKGIAEELAISPKTLDIHRSKVISKMEARTVADLVRWRIFERTPPTVTVT